MNHHNQTNTKPFENSYWVIPGKLLAGEYPATQNVTSSLEKLKQLDEAGINTIIDLTEDGELTSYVEHLANVNPDITHLRFGITDVSIPSKEFMHQILNSIDLALLRGQGVYVHCWGGIGRTGTVIGCWLKRQFGDGIIRTGINKGKSLNELWLDCAKSTLPGKQQSPETQQQLDFITNWPEDFTPRAGLEIIPYAQACFLGQIAGDSLGSLVEFRTETDIAKQYPNKPQHLANGGTFNTLAGQPTDDSELALGLARSIVERKGYDEASVKASYVQWLNSEPFDCGNTIRSSLRGQKSLSSEANGALMRISPLAIYGCNLSEPELARLAAIDADLTHPNPVCKDVNVLFCLLLRKLILQPAKPSDVKAWLLTWCERYSVLDSVKEATVYGFTCMPNDFQHQMGWVLIAWQNTVYQLVNSQSLSQGVINTVAKGGDTDTNAAIAGAALGAMHGLENVPNQWQTSILNCRPDRKREDVFQPRPEQYWPVDVMGLTLQLLQTSEI